MRSSVCICLACLLLAMFCLPVSASSSNVIFSSLSDAALGADSGSNWINSSKLEYNDGVVTIKTGSDSTKTNVYLNKANLKNTGLGTAINAGNAKFTLHTEIQIPTYTTTTVIEAGLVLGATVSADTTVNTRFFLLDKSAERNAVPRPAHVRLRNNLAGSNAYNSDIVSVGVNFTPNTWMTMDVLVDMSTETAQIYVNNTLIDTFTCTVNRLNLAGWKVGFRGYEGVSFRNFAVYSGLIAPNVATPTPVATPTATASPQVTATPTVTLSPQMTTSPTVTVSPQETTAAPSETPVTTVVPNKTQTPGNPNPPTSDSSGVTIILSLGVLIASGILLFFYRKKNKVEQKAK